MHTVSTFEFPTLQHAWEGLNEYLLNEQAKIEAVGGGIYGTEMCLYNTMISVYKAWVDPTFDFGHVLGYTNKKWSKLINNYLDRDYLELIKAEVVERERKKSTNYTHTMHFANSHGSGKDCLISLTFCRAIGNECPVVVYHTRATECTKRMIFDFLLIQKICEYVYGKERTVEVKMFVPFMFIAVEGVLLYFNHVPMDKALRIPKGKEPTVFQKRVQLAYDKFMNIDVETIRYKVHKRSAQGIQRGPDGKPLHGRKPYLAGEIELFNDAKRKPRDIDKLNNHGTL